MAFCIYGISVFSIPVSASADQVCTKTASGQVVCGEPVQKPTGASTSNSKDYPTQVATALDITLKLNSCARKQNHTISCIISFTPNNDGSYHVYSYSNSNAGKLVDNESNEYPLISVQSLKKVVGTDSVLTVSAVKDVESKFTINFGSIPDSVTYATLLQFRFVDQLAKFRGVAFINFDGSISDVPLAARHKDNSGSTNPPPNNISRPKVCLPIVGCV